MHNLCEKLDCGITESVFFDNRFKAAIPFMMTQFDTRNVEWRCVLLFSNLHDAILWHKQKLRFRINELLDQPRTCNTINFYFFLRYPFHIDSSYFFVLILLSAAFKPVATSSALPEAQKCIKKRCGE